MPAGRANPRPGGARALHSTPGRDSGEPETDALTLQSQAQPRCAIVDGGVPPRGLGSRTERKKNYGARIFKYFVILMVVVLLVYNVIKKNIEKIGSIEKVTQL